MSADPSNPDSNESTLLGHYRLVRQVGAGGMGVVYLAHDVELERDVALKVLKPELITGGSGDPAKLRERFLREARAAARLNHPNVASIYQIGRQEDRVFIAMEWLDGGSLSDHLRHSVFLDWREATLAIRDAAAGLAAAHAAGIVHRDIKPSNLMRTRSGMVKLVDFGLARQAAAPSNLTLDGTLLGTPAYFSPEQCRGEPATPLSDLYALACTYFHLLTSRLPFDTADIGGLMLQHLSEPLPDPRRYADEVPEAVCRVLAKCAEKRAEDRYPSADALVTDLNQAMEDRSRSMTTVAIPEAVVEAVADPPTVVPVKTPNNLPQELTSFVGRETEMVRARDLLNRGRLVTMIGAGGTGKTRLAIHIARQLLIAYPDGVWMVELAPLTDPDAVARTLAGVLGLRDAPGKTSAAAVMDAVADRLREQRVLLLLDNCEHLVAPVAAVASAILAGCPNARLLLTSRQPIKLSEELTLRVPSLAIPESDELSVDDLTRLESVRLFTERARAARPNFSVTLENAPAVAKICRQLDGIPLAIELAAARVKILSVQQTATRLNDAFKLLIGGGPSLLPRQQTLRAMIDWSYNLLEPEERTALIRLTVFTGGCTLEAAEAVLADAELPAERILDLLGDLFEQSLLQAEERDDAIRFSMLETIRQYATEKLAETPDGPALLCRHGHYFAEMVRAAGQNLQGAAQPNTLKLLRADYDNLRAALKHATATSDVSTAVRLGAGLAKYWAIQGTLAEGIHLLEAVLALYPPDSSDYAMLLNGIGWLAIYFGEMEKATRWLDQALILSRLLRDGDAEGTTLTNLGTHARENGELKKAYELTMQALAIRRREGDRFGEAGNLNNLGLISKALGKIDQARRLLRQALTLQEELGDTRWVAYAHLNLAELELEQGNVEIAKPMYEMSLQLLSSLNEEWGEAYCMEGIGKCSLALGDIAGARKRFEQTLVIVRKFGDKATIADQLDHLARIAIRQNNGDTATSLSRESINLRLRINDQAGILGSLETQAELLAATDATRAALLLGTAEAGRATLGIRRTVDRLADNERLQKSLRTTLGDTAYEAAFAKGRSLSPKDVLTSGTEER